MSTGLQTQKPTTLRAWVATTEAQQEIAAAVGDIMPPDQFIAHMLVAFQDEKVRACTDQSKFRALKECAALGLLPTLGQVSLIPYGSELKAMPEWEGLKALMERHPDVLEVVGVLVHKDDQLVMHEGQLQHSYDPFDETRSIESAGDLKGGYCKIVYSNGRPPKYHFVTRKHLEKAQACAQTQNVWKKWYYQMALKTLYRDAYARRAVPLDPLVNTRVERVLKADDLNLGNDPVRIVSEGSLEHFEQAREQREARQHQPPEDVSQVNPAADAQEGIDEPPEPDSDTEEANLAAKLNRCRAESGVNQLRELIESNPWLTDEARDRLLGLCNTTMAKVRAKRGDTMEQPKPEGQLF